MKIGMTGTRDGMTPAQATSFIDVANMIIGFQTLSDLVPDEINATIKIKELHHGDCVGADADAHDLAVSMGFETHVHPPEKDEVRAFKDGDVMYTPKGYFARNRDIVNAADILVGFPVTCFETPRGGTWYTINYAKKNGRKPFVVIWPDGSLSYNHTEYVDI